MTTATPITIHASGRTIWIRAAILFALAALTVIPVVGFAQPVFLIFTVALIVSGAGMVLYRKRARVVVDREGVTMHHVQDRLRRFTLTEIDKVMYTHRFRYFTGQIVQTHPAVIFFDAQERQLGFAWGSFFTEDDLRSLFMSFDEADRVERKDGGILSTADPADPEAAAE